jgi:uncharacterized protein YecE (DUF72 family)
MNPRDYLTYYATRFDTVEVDSTFYRTPSPATVRGWAAKTPANFIFAAKVPQVITHEKVLVDCDAEFKQFVATIDILGPKLGPLVFQFPYFNRTVFTSSVQFLARLKAFAKKLPTDHKFAVEIRNSHWLDTRFANVLREHNVTLVLQDQAWMPHPNALKEKFDPITADFTYIRLLGDRKGIEKVTKTWDKVVVDRTRELRGWIDVCYEITKRGVTVYVYVNNHYAGHAPATIATFVEMWNTRGLPQIGTSQPLSQESSLF